LHYYTSPGPNWNSKRSSVDFNEDEWIETLSKAEFMEELINKHSAIMDQYDPAKKVALVVDEWGTWYQGMPGVNPGFLYQQNSLRDALVAAIHLDIFSRHADRVRMANIAQMINVLQAMILTKDDKMVLTPTYYVFEMYKPFKDTTFLPVEISSPQYAHADYHVPAVEVTAGRDATGAVHVALANLDPHQAGQISLKLDGIAAKTASGQILTAEAMNSINTFEQPNTVRPSAFTAAKVTNGVLRVDLPAKSVVVLSLR
jgi:alpha-N-arabinofuranosidase